MMPTAGPIPLGFNQPVRPSDAAKHCKVTAGSTSIALAPAPGAADEPATQLSLALGKPLDPGGKYSVECAGLTGAGGNTPLAKPYSLALRAQSWMKRVCGTPGSWSAAT